jgi:hypothetical protein
MTDLERTNAELRAALILAGKRIVKLNFGRRRPGAADPPAGITRITEDCAGAAGGVDASRSIPYALPWFAPGACP